VLYIGREHQNSFSIFFSVKARFQGSNHAFAFDRVADCRDSLVVRTLRCGINVAKPQ
jgi:hypothetical protein